MSLIDPKLAAILVCPADQGHLVEDVDRSQLECESCGRRFDVRDGIPIMLLDADDQS